MKANDPLVIFGLMCGAIITTGLALNAAGNGHMGEGAEKVAKQVTEGFGV